MAPVDRPFRFSAAVLGVALGLLAGCSGFSSENAPLPDSTFAQVLTEIHLAESRYSTDAPYPSGLRDSIFARYDVRPSEFDETLHYYTRHPGAFRTLYQSVIDTLQTLEFPKRRIALPDSLRSPEDSERPTSLRDSLRSGRE